MTHLTLERSVKNVEISVICFSLAFIGLWWVCGKPCPQQKYSSNSTEKVEINLNPIDLWELKKLK